MAARPSRKGAIACGKTRLAWSSESRGPLLRHWNRALPYTLNKYGGGNDDSHASEIKETLTSAPVEGPTAERSPNGGLGRSDRSAQRSGHQRRAVPRLVARFVALLRPSCPCDPARSTVPSLDCGAPPSTAVIPLPLRSDLAPSSPVGILGGVNHLATIRGRLPEHVCVLRTPSSFTSPNTLYSALLQMRSHVGGSICPTPRSPRFHLPILTRS